MNTQLYSIIDKIEKNGLSDVKLLALVTESSYEVVFYAEKNGEMRQSNDMAENEIISLNFVEEIYESVAKIVRDSNNFDVTKINIIKASKYNIEMCYESKNCRVYGLKKKWKESIGI